MKAATINGVHFTVDPKAHWKNDIGVEEACGFLLPWLVDAAVGKEESIAEGLVHRYQYHMGWHEPKGAEVVDDMFCYPEDEPIYPLLKVEHDTETVIVFQHAIVCVLEDGKLTKWARFD